MDIDLLAARDLAIGIARDVGSIQLDRRINVDLQVVTKAHANDFVSSVDVESETMIVERLRQMHPDDAILGEEQGLREGSSGYVWVIDPLDGTRNYLNRCGPWSVCIALCRDGKPLVGVIHDPAADETFSAVAGMGAWLGEEAIQVSACQNLGGALLGISMNPSVEMKKRVGGALNEMLVDIGDFRRLSAGIHFGYVAAGRLDCALVLGVKPWDVLPGAVIAQEAGAWIGGVHDDAYSEWCTLVATPKIAAELRASLQAALPAD